MSRNNLIILILILVVAGGFIIMNYKKEEMPANNDTATPTTETMPTATDDPMMSETVTVTLNPDETNTSVAQSGTMTVEESDEGLTVMLTMNGYVSTVPQPAHIHSGACPAVGKVVYPLTNVVDGMSTTVLSGVTKADLMGQLPLAVNVHKSADEVSVYTSCGDLTLE